VEGGKHHVIYIDSPGSEKMSLTCRAEEGRDKGHLPGKLRKGRKKVIYKERNMKNMKIVF